MSLARSILKPVRAAVYAFALSGALVLAAPVVGPPVIADARAETEKKPPKQLPLGRYLTLAPFTLPLFDGQDVVEQMTIVVALELVDEDQRQEVSRLVPKIRDAMYRELYNMVSFRRKGAALPEVDEFKVRLHRTVRPIVGEKLVKSLVVQQAFKRPPR